MTCVYWEPKSRMTICSFMPDERKVSAPGQVFWREKMAAREICHSTARRPGGRQRACETAYCCVTVTWPVLASYRIFIPAGGFGIFAEYLVFTRSSKAFRYPPFATINQLTP